MSRIIRAPRPESGFTLIDNATARDTGLSYRALGILTYLLSHTDGWHTSAETLSQGQNREGRGAILTALKELRTAGYVRQEKRQDERGRWTTLTYVYDTPQTGEAAPIPTVPAVVEHDTPAASSSTAETAPSSPEVDAVMTAWREAARGLTAQKPAAVAAVVRDALNAGADSDAVTRAVLAIVRDGEPVIGWRLTRYLNGKTDRRQDKSIHYAADAPKNWTAYDEDLSLVCTPKPKPAGYYREDL